MENGIIPFHPIVQVNYGQSLNDVYYILNHPYYIMFLQIGSQGYLFMVEEGLAIMQVDSIIRESFRSLADYLSSGEWKGCREREVVSLFCFGHLLYHCRPETILSDPTQIAIEVVVPQIANQCELTGKTGCKPRVSKDIVIWPEPRMTCWDNRGNPTVRPLSIILWKHNAGSVSSYDLDWLCYFSAQLPNFVGYAVCTNQPFRRFTLSCSRIFFNNREDRWIHII